MGLLMYISCSGKLPAVAFELLPPELSNFAPTMSSTAANSNTNHHSAELSPGLVVSTTDTIRSFLRSASKDLHLSEQLRRLASDLSCLENAPYRSLRSIWIASSPDLRSDLVKFFSGSDFVFSSPQPREKSEELKARLRKLSEMAERREYAELVKDITPKKDEEPFSSYKEQIGFGLHVVLIMFTGYVCGYFAFRALFGRDPIMSVAGGIIGLVGGMLVETLLFIIKTNEDLRSPASTSRAKKNQ